MIEIGREYSAEVVDIALPSGHGVARLEELVVFIPDAVPGDTVRVRIGRLQKRFAYGEIVRIEEESSHRQQPRCPHFGQCGGCDLQALPYDMQLRIKEHHLSQVLTRIGGKDLEGAAPSPIVPSVDEFFYRSKVEFSFSPAGGKAAVGLSERLSPLRPFTGRTVPVESCALFSPAAAEALALVREMIEGSHLEAYDPFTGKGTLKRLVLREAKGTGEIMMHLMGGPDVGRHLDRVKNGLIGALPQLKSLYATSGSSTRLLWGVPAIEEKIAGLTLRVYPLSFFQPNPRTAAELYARILPVAGIRGTERVLGLYCGVGPIEPLPGGLCKRGNRHRFERGQYRLCTRKRHTQQVKELSFHQGEGREGSSPLLDKNRSPRDRPTQERDEQGGPPGSPRNRAGENSLHLVQPLHPGEGLAEPLPGL